MNWRNIGGHYNWEWFYEQEAARMQPGGVAVELGIWLGRSLCHLASMLPEDAVVYGVDHFDCDQDDEAMQALVDRHGGILRETVNNIYGCGVQKQVRIIQSDSAAAASIFPTESVDLVFIDACKDYEWVKQDIMEWLPTVRPGGTIAGHDYSDSWPGVKQAVNELIPGRKTKGNLWWYHMPEGVEVSDGC